MFIGDPPEKCQLCGIALDERFVDGKVRGATSWAYMCEDCHKLHGIGFGTGRAQLFAKVGSGFEKIEG